MLHFFPLSYPVYKLKTSFYLIASSPIITIIYEPKDAISSVICDYIRVMMKKKEEEKRRQGREKEEGEKKEERERKKAYHKAHHQSNLE
jgi:hypothetical protein